MATIEAFTESERLMTRERLIADQSVRELAPLLTPNQRALVSLLATAELHDLELEPLVLGLAEETGAAPVFRFAELLVVGKAAELFPEVGLDSAPHPLEIAPLVDGLMPQTCRVALNSARASGSLQAFYKSWLAQSIDERVHFVRHEHTNAATLGRLAFRSAICIWLISFLLLFVIPEHQKMYEEFDIELNSVARTFLWVADLFAKTTPLFFMLLFCLFIYVVIFQRGIFGNYMRRWLPGRWRQMVLPNKVMKRKLMAWDLLAFRGLDRMTGPEPDPGLGPDGASTVDWDALVEKRELSSREADIMKSTTRLETQAWLLRNMADKKLQSRKTRFAFAVGAFSYLFQAVLAVIIILATFTIFSMLIELMRGLL